MLHVRPIRSNNIARRTPTLHNPYIYPVLTALHPALVPQWVLLARQLQQTVLSELEHDRDQEQLRCEGLAQLELGRKWV